MDTHARPVAVGSPSGASPLSPPAGGRRERRAAARPDDVRRHNLSLVLRELHRDGALSRAELTQRLALSRSTIGVLVTDLCDLGLTEESVPVGGDRAGRPSHVVAPRADGPCAIAVDVEVDRLSVAAVTLGGTVRHRRVHVLDAGRTAASDIARQLAGAVREVVAEGPSTTPLGLGVSVPGTVSTASGTVEVAPNLGWHSEPLGPLLEELLPDLPVSLANDADMGVLAEHVRGAARGAHDVVYLTGKVGVGAGILVDGHPLRGGGGLAGEIGHTVLDSAGPPCHCGGRGCVEQFIGEATLLRLAGRAGPPDPDVVADVLAAARAGDPVATHGVAQVAGSLGLVLANLVNLLNPQVVVLGGALAGVFATRRADVLAALESQAMGAARAMVEVRLSALGGDSSLLGAAEMAFSSLLTDPLALAAT